VQFLDGERWSERSSAINIEDVSPLKDLDSNVVVWASSFVWMFFVSGVLVCFTSVGYIIHYGVGFYLLAGVFGGLVSSMCIFSGIVVSLFPLPGMISSIFNPLLSVWSVDISYHPVYILFVRYKTFLYLPYSCLYLLDFR
jgi:hypothetical protein